MNRIESSAARQMSNGVLEPLAVSNAGQPIACTPAIFLATIAALVVTTHGFDAPDPGDVAGIGEGRLDGLSSADLVGVSRTARSGR